MKKIDLYSRCHLSLDDIQTLHLLYLPLASSDSISLYMVLYSLLERSSLKCLDVKLEEILDSISFSFKKYDEAKSKLEALNLIKTYTNEEKEIIFLQAPSTAKTFINDTNLGLYLASKIGEEAYLKLVDKFSIPNVILEGYTNVTKTFDEVFNSVITTSFKDVEPNIIGKKINKGANYSDNVFDFDLFVSSIKTEFITETIYGDFKKKITSIVCTYGFCLEQVINLYNDSINKKGEFDFQTFKRKAQKIGGEMFNTTPKLILKNEENTLALRFDNINAQELLVQMIGKDYNPIYLNRITNIYEQVDFPVGVINVLITYVYRNIKDIPPTSYFTKVAKTWKENGINNTIEALNFLQTGNYPIQTFKNYNRKTTKNSSENLNDWQQEAIEKLKRGESL